MPVHLDEAVRIEIQLENGYLVLVRLTPAPTFPRFWRAAPSGLPGHQYAQDRGCLSAP